MPKSDLDFALKKMKMLQMSMQSCKTTQYKALKAVCECAFRYKISF